MSRPHLEFGGDMSGDEKSGNNKCLAIAVGTDERVGTIMHTLKDVPIHMRDVHARRVTQDALAKLDLTGMDDILVFCIRIEQKKVLDEVLGMRRNKGNKRAAITVKKRFNKYVWYKIREEVEQFARRYRLSVSEIEFQCDFDCLDFANHNSIKRTGKGRIHSICDGIAWFNSHGIEPRGVRHMDLHEDILRHLRDS